MISKTWTKKISSDFRICKRWIYGDIIIKNVVRQGNSKKDIESDEKWRRDQKTLVRHFPPQSYGPSIAPVIDHS